MIIIVSACYHILYVLYFIYQTFKCSSLATNKILVIIVHFLNDLFLDVSVTVPEFNSILQKNNMDIVPGSQMHDHRECGEIHIDETYGEALGAKSNPTVTAQIDTEQIAEAGGTPEYDKQSSLTIVTNTDFDVALDLVEQEMNSVSIPSHHSSYIFDSPDNSEVLSSPSLHKISEKVFNIPAVPRKPSSGLRRLTKWWNQQKFKIIRLVTACCPCIKISSTQD